MHSGVHCTARTVLPHELLREERQGGGNGDGPELQVGTQQGLVAHARAQCAKAAQSVQRITTTTTPAPTCSPITKLAADSSASA